MDLHRLADNRTSMAVRCVPMDDRHGREVVVLVAKRTYAVSRAGAVHVALSGSPIRLTDVPTSRAKWSSVRYPGDLVDDKPGTDILLVGKAYPPPDRAVTEQDVTVRVETGQRTIRKTVRVYGPRVWYRTSLGVAPGAPAQLAPTPLLYELAYGGVDDSDPRHILIEPRNPAGTGVAADRTKLIGALAPAIEDPRHPLTSQRPAPAGFGAIAAHWAPRSEWAGTYDEAWQRDRAPVRPLDFQPRHHCCSDPELWSETPLVGDEPVEVLGATPEGAWRFRLPRYEPVFEVFQRRGASKHHPRVDTYLIDAEAGRVELTWRVSVPLPRKSQFLEVIRVLGPEHLPDRLWTRS